DEDDRSQHRSVDAELPLRGGECLAMLAEALSSALDPGRLEEPPIDGRGFARLERELQARERFYTWVGEDGFDAPARDGVAGQFVDQVAPALVGPDRRGCRRNETEHANHNPPHEPSRPIPIPMRHPNYLPGTAFVSQASGAPGLARPSASRVERDHANTRT